MIFSWGWEGYFRLGQINPVFCIHFVLSVNIKLNIMTLSPYQIPCPFEVSCFCTLSKHLSQRKGCGGKKINKNNLPPVYLATPEILWAERSSKWFTFIIHAKRKQKSRNLMVRLLHRVVLNSSSMLALSVCSNKVSRVLLVMISDMSGETGGPCDVCGTSEVV